MMLAYTHPVRCQHRLFRRIKYAIMRRRTYVATHMELEACRTATWMGVYDVARVVAEKTGADWLSNAEDEEVKFFAGN